MLFTEEQVVSRRKFTDLIVKGGAIYYEMIFLPSIKMHGQLNEITYDFIRSDGSSFPALVNSVAVKDDSGNLLAINATVVNISDRKSYESELLHAKQRADNEKKQFEYLANLIPDMIWTASTGGRLDYVNDRFISYFDLDARNFSRHRVLHLLHADDRRKFMRAWGTAISSGNDLVAEVRFLNQFKTFEWHLIRSIAFKNDDGSIAKWFGSCTNINEQVLALQRKDEFIQIASHELKTPITSLKAYNQLLLRSEMPEKAKAFLKKSASTISNLQFLISSLLDVTQIDSRQFNLNPEPVSLIEIVSNSVDIVGFSYNSHKIITEWSSVDDVMVNADKQRLTQVMINLISNAIKYSPGKDKVVIRLDKSPDLHRVRVEVTDFGMGIPPEKLDKVFDKFYRVSETKNNNKVSGLGLGLYITQSIVALHGSKIMVSSQVNHGTTFYFSLPII